MGSHNLQPEGERTQAEPGHPMHLGEPRAELGRAGITQCAPGAVACPHSGQSHFGDQKKCCLPVPSHWKELVTHAAKSRACTRACV